ncbi:beta-1,3-galactosyltransferase 1 [Ctenopharyngodon idella]|uniref:beta-1,3-galactosyltransferase 1 n=1 Tax=Ctenopharyngodon idella TaxID=7959 RepID=UPI00222F28AA|nr:beta-1,3-galactosyltransferase 1 [Ctenopharyngodon idella]XP_051765041.1 beta-1,3-galactosyltransferase 1 [Ctenopharyngodon idella]XP_051765042.1 beta-1,3-galactosyltransferase 1 [Ctenopharyngodon idella]XP_051765043.1 beta-1,3-galactosyltransferase 1 [Ctenopharyngodon idella]XP_051765044.1 beta-1,3-galactosyltransferase 1 [Ctenopharyngodon idella]XP_051765045.1 beta-1,3-galactosyltransferase 1 [Ctenopharyngodon idella]XP_051765046.1 beta-1,3-galactosyltransferase 1 [Ctenopharyngodon idell
MSCKKWLLVCLLVSGVFLALYLTYSPMTKWFQVEKEPQRYPVAKRPSTEAPTEEPFQEEPGMYHVAYPRKYKFIIDQPEICEQQKPYLVVIVPVPPWDVDARNGIRKTWGEQKVFGDKMVLVLFLLGLHSGNDEEMLQERLRNESQQYQDLLQSNFQDSYRNLTIKTMVMMEWLSRKCQQATYAMKVDADVLLNMNNLIKMLVSLNTVQGNYMTGLVWYESPVIRDPSSKFFLPYDVYSKNTYPPYPLGMCYIISVDLPQKFLQESKQIKPIYIEDAYLGICLERLGIVPIKPPNIEQFVVKPPQYNRCYYSGLIAVLTENTNQMTSYWLDIHSSSQPC